MKIYEILRVIAPIIGLPVVILATMVLTCCESPKKEPWESAPLKDGEVEQVHLGDKAGISIDRIRFYSHEMQEPRFFLVLAPKADMPVDRVFILNHGWFDRPESMLDALKLDQVFTRLLADGELKPALLVLPDVRFPDFFRRNSSLYPFPQYPALVAEEVAGLVTQRYNIPFSRDKWGIGGFSFGGYLSLDVGRRYSGRFGSVSVISSFFDEDWTFWPDKPPDPGRLDSKGRGKQTTVAPGPAPRLFLACGESDRFIGNMVRLHQTFQKLGIPHEWSTAPGGHTWAYWSSVLEKMLRFHLGQAQGVISENLECGHEGIR